MTYPIANIITWFQRRQLAFSYVIEFHSISFERSTTFYDIWLHLRNVNVLLALCKIPFLKCRCCTYSKVSINRLFGLICIFRWLLSEVTAIAPPTWHFGLNQSDVDKNVYFNYYLIFHNKLNTLLTWL